jgi:hypothetical protein
MAKFVYLGVIVICVVAISFCGYYFLGGFDPIEVQEVENMSFNIAGKPYKGKYYKSDSLRRIQEEIGELILKDQVNGNYAEVSYVNTGITEEEVDLFVGTIFFENEIQIPGTFKVREFAARKFLAVKLNMHYAVRPSEQEVQAILYTYAREKGYKLEDYFINITFKNNSLEVYVPLKD